jgi:hypothetical protein
MSEQSVIKESSGCIKTHCPGVEIEKLQQTIQDLNKIIHQKNVEILEKDELISNLENEISSINELMGYSPDMTYEEKIKFHEECEKDLEEAELSLDESTKRAYENDMEREDRMIECALEINELQFEVSEIFKTLKSCINKNKHEDYKKYKRNFYAMLDFFYHNYRPHGSNSDEGRDPSKGDLGSCNEEEKIDVFDLISEIVDKEKRVYELDEEIKNIK